MYLACIGAAWERGHALAVLPAHTLPGVSDSPKALLKPSPSPSLSPQRCCTWWNSTWKRGSLTKKQLLSSIWRHQDTRGRASGERPKATVSCALGQAGVGRSREAGRGRSMHYGSRQGQKDQIKKGWGGPHTVRTNNRGGQSGQGLQAQGEWPLHLPARTPCLAPQSTTPASTHS